MAPYTVGLVSSEVFAVVILMAVDGIFSGMAGVVGVDTVVGVAGDMAIGAIGDTEMLWLLI